LEQDRAAKAVLDALRTEAAQQLAAGGDDDKIRKLVRHIEYTSRMPNLRAMIEAAKSEPGMTRRLREFDAAPAVLGVANGVLDLDKSGLLPISPDLLVSKRCAVPFDLGATCPKFQTFLEEILPDPSVRAFLQSFMGYCLAGQVREPRCVPAHEKRGPQQSAIVVVHLESRSAYERMLTRLVIHEAMFPSIGAAPAEHGRQQHVDRFAGVRDRRSHIFRPPLRSEPNLVSLYGATA
jgi:DNA-binding Lrp family transcriptional regulator